MFVENKFEVVKLFIFPFVDDILIVSILLFIFKFEPVAKLKVNKFTPPRVISIFSVVIFDALKFVNVVFVFTIFPVDNLEEFILNIFEPDVL
jgi:hypothetical protein